MSGGQDELAYQEAEAERLANPATELAPITSKNWEILPNSLPRHYRSWRLFRLNEQGDLVQGRLLKYPDRVDPQLVAARYRQSINMPELTEVYCFDWVEERLPGRFVYCVSKIIIKG